MEIVSIQGSYGSRVYRVVVEKGVSRRIIVRENIDIKIVYDDKAKNHLQSIEKSGEDLADSIEYAFEYGFGQYWPYMDFHTEYDANWLFYDDDGYTGTVTEANDYAQWRNDALIGWDDLEGQYEPDDLKIHGEYFDLLILCTYDERFSAGGASESNYIVINFAPITFNRWNIPEDRPEDDSSPYRFGFYSLVMHEVGHYYGITGMSGDDDNNNSGDTWDKRNSVMDAYRQYDYPSQFDLGHIITIDSNIGMWSH